MYRDKLLVLWRDIAKTFALLAPTSDRSARRFYQLEQVSIFRTRSRLLALYGMNKPGAIDLQTFHLLFVDDRKYASSNQFIQLFKA